MSYFPLEKKYIFRYEKGRLDGLKRHTYTEGTRRELIYYENSARIDGLVSRLDEIGAKIKVPGLSGFCLVSLFSFCSDNSLASSDLTAKQIDGGAVQV